LEIFAGTDQDWGLCEAAAEVSSSHLQFTGQLLHFPQAQTSTLLHVKSTIWIGPLITAIAINHC